MPCLDQEEHIDVEVAAHVEQVVQFVRHRPDVEAAEHESRTPRRRVSVDMDAPQARRSQRSTDRRRVWSSATVAYDDGRAVANWTQTW